MHLSTALHPALTSRYGQLCALRAAATLRSSSAQLATTGATEVLGLVVLLTAVGGVGLGLSGPLADGVIVYAALGFSRQIAALVEGLQGTEQTVLGAVRVAGLLGRERLPRHGHPTGARAADVAAVRERPADPALVLVARGLVPDLPPDVTPAPLDLALRPGEWVVISGPSGVGKSSLVRCLAGAAPASGQVQGTASVAMVDADLPALPLDVADLVTVDGSLIEIARAAGLPVPAGPLAELGHPARQAVALARAVDSRPDVLLLDEATSSLTTGDERAVLGCVRALAPRTAVVAVLHRPDQHDLFDRACTVAPGSRAVAAVETRREVHGRRA